MFSGFAVCWIFSRSVLVSQGHRSSSLVEALCAFKKSLQWFFCTFALSLRTCEQEDLFSPLRWNQTCSTLITLIVACASLRHHPVFRMSLCHPPELSPALFKLKLSLFQKSSRIQKMQSSFVTTEMNQFVLMKLVQCKIFFFLARWVPSYPQEVVSAFKQADRQTDRQQGFVATGASEREKNGEREQRRKRKRETEWKFNQARLLKGRLGERRIYSCLASSPST